jgi:hypothetical protein
MVAFNTGIKQLNPKDDEFSKRLRRKLYKPIQGLTGIFYTVNKLVQLFCNNNYPALYK